MTLKSCGITLVMIVFTMLNARAQTVEYQDYKVASLDKEYFVISYDKNDIRITTFEDSTAVTSVFPIGSLSTEKGLLMANGLPLFDDLGLLINERHYYYDSIYNTAISESEKTVTITFYTREPSVTRTARFRRGNVVSVGKPLTVEKGDFVRGTVMAIGTDIEVFGEVNRDIIVINGDVYIGPDAVARGDIAAIDGHVTVAGKASVYGDVFDINRRRVKLKHRFARDMNEWSVLGKFSYDRVDGLGLYLGLEYRDPDSLLPSFSALTGYAFNSERWRFRVGLEQTILRHPAIVAGADYYRRLADEDGWLLDESENTAFALLATEDFRDYYEAEGGSIYVKARPMSDVIAEVGYRFEETGWLDARRHLWSLFGGDKLFPENFNTVSPDFRTVGIAEIDSTGNAALYARAAWDTRDKTDPFDKSAWYATADFEWSSNALSSDFDYLRYMFGVRRYQKIHRRAMLLTRGVLGGSDAYLPMYKKFFLGGLGTMPGYDHKEYMGTAFWLVNTEYRFEFSGAEIALSVLWDIGQITKLDGSAEVKHDVGLALYFESDFKISLSKRLDRSYDDNPVFYVRLNHVF